MDDTVVMFAIDAEHLVYHFGALSAVHGVSLEVKPGEIFRFIGAKGAGKTTTTCT